MEPRLFITVGIAGCGKSTWANENLNKPGMFEEIYSSDAYRKKLLGDENDQSNNTLVFETMHKDIITALKAGKNICYDATNLNRKNRKHILTLIKDNKIKCEKIAVLFEVELCIILRQNAMRERNLPASVINRMLKQFEIPFLGEGFDRIETVYRRENSIQALVEPINKMSGFEQENPNHSKTLLKHCMECYHNVDAINNFELNIAALLHDYGKVFTKEYDKEKGYYHYIGHENYGAYMSLMLDYTPLNVDPYKIAFYINYHMEPYKLKNAKPLTIEKYKAQFGTEWENIMLLHNADKLAH